MTVSYLLFYSGVVHGFCSCVLSLFPVFLASCMNVLYPSGGNSVFAVCTRGVYVLVGFFVCSSGLVLFFSAFMISVCKFFILSSIFCLLSFNVLFSCCSLLISVSCIDSCVNKTVERFVISSSPFNTACCSFCVNAIFFLPSGVVLVTASFICRLSYFMASLIDPLYCVLCLCVIASLLSINCSLVY